MLRARFGARRLDGPFGGSRAFDAAVGFEFFALGGSTANRSATVAKSTPVGLSDPHTDVEMRSDGSFFQCNGCKGRAQPGQLCYGG